MSHVLFVEDFEVRTGDQRLLLAGIQVAVRKGRLLHVSGPNGVGKSSLVKALLQVMRDRSSGGGMRARLRQVRGQMSGFFTQRTKIATRGQGDRPIKHCPAIEEVAYLPQIHNLHLALPLSMGDILELYGHSYGEGESKEASHRHSRCPLINTDLMGRQWNTASGGERQRVLMSCLLTKNPKMMLLDEPFNHVDGSTKALLLDRLYSYLTDQQGCALVISHQDVFGGHPIAACVDSYQIGKEHRR